MTATKTVELVAFLGPEGSYSFETARKRFGPNAALMACMTISATLDAVATGRTNFAVLPLENSTFGSVQQTLDWFVAHAQPSEAPSQSTGAKAANRPPVVIHAEILVPIHHSLLSTSALIQDVRRVYSHPQALGQCAKWLDAHLPDAERVSTSSTSQAAMDAANEPGSAAICNAVCADLYHLHVLDQNIEDVQGNTTRFIVLGKEDGVRTGQDNTLVQFTVDYSQPGALCDALAAVKQSGINIVKIDSRPSLQRLWHYVFFIELEGHIQEHAVSVAISRMSECCSNLYVLGSYPSLRHRSAAT